VRRIAREADVVGLTITEFAPANEDEARAGAPVIAAICEAAGAHAPASRHGDATTHPTNV